MQKEEASSHFLAMCTGGKHCKGMGELREGVRRDSWMSPSPLPLPGWQFSPCLAPPGDQRCPHCSSLAPSTPRSPSTGYGPDLTLTPLPRPDEFWTPSHWEFRLGKPHLEKAFSMAACRGP